MCCGPRTWTNTPPMNSRWPRKSIPSLRKGMLCHGGPVLPQLQTLAESGRKTGADLLWRTRQNARLDVEKRLPDGSYLSRIYASTPDRRNERNGIVVRVIDYRLKDVAGCRTDLPADHHHPGSQAGAGQRTGRPVSRAMGDRNHPGRVENSFARRPDRAAQQDAGTGPAGVLRSADGAFCHSRPDARSRVEGR